MVRPPRLADGMLVVYLNQVYGLDAATGKLVWEQPPSPITSPRLLGATLGGQQVIVTQRGDVVRPKDGELLVRLRGSEVPNDIGWAPPVILGNRVYTLRYGVAWMLIRDYTHVERTRQQRPEVVADLTLRPRIQSQTGRQSDRTRWTAASPLMQDDILYSVDIYQTLYATDLKSGKMLYRQDLDLDGLMHCNAVPVAASPTLIGKNIVVLDNQGTAVVVGQDRRFSRWPAMATATQLERRPAIPRPGDRLLRPADRRRRPHLPSRRGAYAAPVHWREMNSRRRPAGLASSGSLTMESRSCIG